MSTPENKPSKTAMQNKFHNPKSNPEIRRQAALRRLGCDDPRCVRCGEDEPSCLELHHIAGQAYDDATIILCRNCHRKASYVQRDHPPQVNDPPGLAEQAGQFMLGLADMFELLIEVCRRFGLALIESCRPAVS